MGKITSSELRNGPLAERGCTDIICCILFVAFIVASTGICIYGFSKGDPNKLITPMDADNKACGYGNYKDYNYIYFAAPSKSYLWRTVCVKKCPVKGDTSL